MEFVDSFEMLSEQFSLCVFFQAFFDECKIFNVYFLACSYIESQSCVHLIYFHGGMTACVLNNLQRFWMFVMKSSL